MKKFKKNGRKNGKQKGSVKQTFSWINVGYHRNLFDSLKLIKRFIILLDYLRKTAFIKIISFLSSISEKGLNARKC